MIPTHREKLEWARLAQDAYAHNYNHIGHRYSVAAAQPEGAAMYTLDFDKLQTGYRLWLIGGLVEAAPFINQHIA